MVIQEFVFYSELGNAFSSVFEQTGNADSSLKLFLWTGTVLGSKDLIIKKLSDFNVLVGVD